MYYVYILNIINLMQYIIFDTVLNFCNHNQKGYIFIVGIWNHINMIYIYVYCILIIYYYINKHVTIFIYICVFTLL